MNIRTIPVEKTCPSCKRSFKVCPPGKSSRFYPDYDQDFCSRPCAFKARYRSGSTCNQLVPTQAAYIAGFFDGEGSAYLYIRRDAVAMRVSFANSNLEGLEVIKGWLGVGNTGSKSRETAEHKIGYILMLNSDAALSLLEQIKPYVVLKREQVRLAIDFQHRLKDPSLKADRSWQYDYREQVQALNRRGPSTTG
jgi:hypothetical protein